MGNKMENENSWFDKMFSYSFLCICLGAVVVCCLQVLHGIGIAKESGRKAEIYQQQIEAGLQDSAYQDIKPVGKQAIGDGFSYQLTLGKEKILNAKTCDKQREATIVISSEDVNNAKVEWRKTILLTNAKTKNKCN